MPLRPSLDRIPVYTREFPHKSSALRVPFVRSALAMILGASFIAPAFADSTCPDADNPFVNIEPYQSSHNGEVVAVADPVYATDRNFTGAVVPGYEQNTAQKVWLAPDAISALNDALHSVQAKIAIKIGTANAQRIRFIVKDGYRPHRATQAFVDYDRTNHLGLATNGWVAGGISGHNRGYTVDLTLGYVNDAGVLQEVWMGAHFDEFNSHSNHGTGGRTVDVRTDSHLSYDDPANRPHDGYIVLSDITTLELRTFLKAGMGEAFFSSYSNEYWHYILRGHGDAQCYDRPIQ